MKSLILYIFSISEKVKAKKQPIRRQSKKLENNKRKVKKVDVMLKTNCKKVKEAIRSYILECVNNEIESAGRTLPEMIEEFNELSKFDKSHDSISRSFGEDFGYFAFEYYEMKIRLHQILSFFHKIRHSN